MVAPRASILLERFLQFGDPKSILVIDKGLGDPCAIEVADALTSAPAKAKVIDATLLSFAQIKELKKNPVSALIVLHADTLSDGQMQDLKWFFGSFIACQSVSTNKNGQRAFQLDFSILADRCRQSVCQMIMDSAGEGTRGVARMRDVDAEAEAEDRRARRMQGLLAGSTFRLELSEGEREARQSVDLPHFAAQRQEESLPRYDYHEDEDDDDDDAGDE